METKMHAIGKTSRCALCGRTIFPKTIYCQHERKDYHVRCWRDSGFAVYAAFGAPLPNKEG